MAALAADGRSERWPDDPFARPPYSGNAVGDVALKLEAAHADAREDRYVRLQPPDDARLPGEEVSMLKKLILRVAYSGLALAALAFVLGAGAKHPH